MSRNIFVSKKKKNVHVQIITQSGRAELGMYAEDERGRVPTRCTAFIHNLRGQGGWWVVGGGGAAASVVEGSRCGGVAAGRSCTVRVLKGATAAAPSRIPPHTEGTA